MLHQMGHKRHPYPTAQLYCIPSPQLRTVHATAHRPHISPTLFCAWSNFQSSWQMWVISWLLWTWHCKGTVDSWHIISEAMGGNSIFYCTATRTHIYIAHCSQIVWSLPRNLSPSSVSEHHLPYPVLSLQHLYPQHPDPTLSHLDSRHRAYPAFCADTSRLTTALSNSTYIARINYCKNQRSTLTEAATRTTSLTRAVTRTISLTEPPASSPQTSIKNVHRSAHISWPEPYSCKTKLLDFHIIY